MKILPELRFQGNYTGKRVKNHSWDGRGNPRLFLWRSMLKGSSVHIWRYTREFQWPNQIIRLKNDRKK